LEISANVAHRKPANGHSKPRRRHVATKPKLLMRSHLDQRTSAAKFLDRLVVEIQNDLGGCSELSTYRIEAFAGDGVVQRKANFDYARGGSRLAYTSRIASPRRRLRVARRGAIFLHI